MIDELRKIGLLRDRDSMLEYCYGHPDGRFMGNFSREYGYRVDTEQYTYLFRCIPTPGDNNFYCYAYVSDYLNAHMEKAAQGIRFIDSRYHELFRIPDGGHIIITHADGEKIKAYCRYIDETHAVIGKSIYHICEFAERMENNGAFYAPAEPPMPELCFTVHPSSGEVIKIFQGEHGYTPLKMPSVDSDTARKYADDRTADSALPKRRRRLCLPVPCSVGVFPPPTQKIMTKTAIHANRNRKTEVRHDE